MESVLRVVSWSLVESGGVVRIFGVSCGKFYPFRFYLNSTLIAIDYQFQLSTNCDKFRQLLTTPKKSKLRQSRSPKCDTFRQIQFSISFDKLRDILFSVGFIILYADYSQNIHNFNRQISISTFLILTLLLLLYAENK